MSLREQELPADGTYTIVVDGWGDAVGPYTLTFFNPVFRTAPIADGQKVERALQLPGEEHGYTFEGKAGERVTVYVDNRTTGGSRKVGVVLRGPEGAELAKDYSDQGDYDVSLREQELPADGTYTLVVDGYADAVGPYGLELKKQPELAPMPKPEREIGYKWVGLKNGKPYWRTLVSETAETLAWETSEGCSFTNSGKTTFGLGDPWLKWSGCSPWADGTQTFSLDGEIWPLEVGKKWRYSLSGSNVRGDSWSAERTCEIPGTARIATGIGVHDTYKVVCKDPWNTGTYYMSPALETIVYSEWYNRPRGSTWKYKYTGE